jgi:hypothetical protein
MDPALTKVGLPVSCAFGDCETKGFVKPKSDYGGWYKSRLFRFKRKRWFCPKHFEEGKAIDDKFYEKYKTPVAKLPPEDATEALYKLLD